MSYEARIEKDSITQYGERLTTFVVTLPRLVLAELNTHKMISKSSASSRAIPSATQIKRLREDAFDPVYWGKNQKGMQADQELTPDERSDAIDVWHHMRETAIAGTERLMAIGVHKQIASRPLEAWMWHTVIVTGTEWSNFFHLRDNKMAQPEIQKAAGLMSELYRASRPLLLEPANWHTPFIQPEDGDLRLVVPDLVKVSVGRAARVSYLTHDGKRDHQADITLAESLLKNGHMAPWEHVARPMDAAERHLFGKTRWFPKSGRSMMSPEWQGGETQYFLGNFNGWVQARKLIHGEQDILAFER